MITEKLVYLHSCDEEGNEFPLNFNAESALRKTIALKHTLETYFGVKIGGPFQDQDCTYYARLRLPLESIESRFQPYQPDIYISNFGNMIAIQNEYMVRTNYLRQIKVATEEHGFVWMNESDLLDDYDGKNFPGISTWWHRFFDYI